MFRAPSCFLLNKEPRLYVLPGYLRFPLTEPVLCCCLKYGPADTGGRIGGGPSSGCTRSLGWKISTRQSVTLASSLTKETWALINYCPGARFISSSIKPPRGGAIATIPPVIEDMNQPQVKRSPFRVPVRDMIGMGSAGCGDCQMPRFLSETLSELHYAKDTFPRI
jgi:hypothetical protein